MNIFILGVICLLVEVAAVAGDGDTVSGNAGGHGMDVEREIRRTGRNIKRELVKLAENLDKRATKLMRTAGRETDAEEIVKIQEKEQEFSDASKQLLEISTQLGTFFNKGDIGFEDLLNKLRPVPEIPSEPPVEEAKRNLKMNNDPLTKLINALKLYT